MLLENFESEFFFTHSMAELLNQLNQHIEAYLAMVCILQEEDKFSQALLGDSETLKMIESLAGSGDQLISVYATVSKLM